MCDSVGSPRYRQPSETFGVVNGTCEITFDVTGLSCAEG